MDLRQEFLVLKKRVLQYIESGQADTMTEMETRGLLIDPFLQAIGWDINNLQFVRRGWRGSKATGDQKEADYALFIEGKTKPTVIVEAKRFKCDLSKDSALVQTLTYAFLNGVEWCILTNGQHIYVYDAFSRERAGERCLFDPIDLKKLDTSEGITAEQAGKYFQMFTPEGLQANLPAKFRDLYKIQVQVKSCLIKMYEDRDPSLIRLINKRLRNEYTTGEILDSLRGLDIQVADREVRISKPKAASPEMRNRKGKKARPGTKVAKKHELWEKLDTIVCPAREDGFQETFIGEKRWYAIRIQKDKIPYIKYIAMYRVYPISAITHYGEVESIKPWRESNKYVVNLKGEPREIGPIVMDRGPNASAFVLYSHNYTNIGLLLKAKTLSECFGDVAKGNNIMREKG
jgi:hypothetical protein